jgi:Bacteriophage head to tail connecting protein
MYPAEDNNQGGPGSDRTGQTDPSCRARYDALAVERTTYLMRARENALVTIPALFPPQGHNNATVYPAPYQSVGADGLNNLSSKILLALMPPGDVFFKLAIDDFVIAAIQQKAQDDGNDADDARAKFEEALNKVERAVVNKLETMGARTQLGEAIDQLIVSGNACIHILDSCKLVMHRLENFVCKRDVDGNPLEIITRQSLSRSSLDPKARALLDAQKLAGLQTWEDNASDRPSVDHTNVVDLYSRYYLADGKWTYYQELAGREVPGTRSQDPEDKPRIIPVRWTAIQGEDYGRGFIEEYLGDLQSLEALSESLIAFAGVAARVLFGVNEAGTTRKEDIAQAKNGDVVDADFNKDVTVLQVQKMNDMKIVKETADGIEARLNRAFLRSSSVQRDAERVTAEEIRFIARELETTLGGQYAILGHELQKPIVVRAMANMMRKSEIPPLPKGVVNPQIVAGLEGLGREADSDRYQAFVQRIKEAMGPKDSVGDYLNMGALFKRIGTALSIDMDGLVISDEQRQATQQAQAQQDNLRAVAPKLVDAASKAQLAAGQQGSAQAPQPAPTGQ